MSEDPIKMNIASFVRTDEFKTIFPFVGPEDTIPLVEIISQSIVAIWKCVNDQKRDCHEYTKKFLVDPVFKSKLNDITDEMIGTDIQSNPDTQFFTQVEKRVASILQSPIRKEKTSCSC